MKSWDVGWFVLIWGVILMGCTKENPCPAPRPVELECPDSSQVHACELALLPPISSSGANTFGCLVNGKAWISNKGASSQFYVDYYQGIFSLNAARHGYSPRRQNDDQILETFLLGSINYQQFGKQEIDNAIHFGLFTDYEHWCEYDSDSEITGYLEYIKFDTINWIASGTFAFTTYLPDEENELGCDTLYVTDGRFDVRIR